MAIARLEGLGKSKKFNDIGTTTRYLPACSIVPTTLPRAPHIQNTDDTTTTNSVLYYLRAEATATRPITDPAQCRYS
jgi:hypothetical protein